MQSVVDSDQDPFNSGLECSPLWVPWDNNVGWHNVNIIENPSPSLGVAYGYSPVDIQQSTVQLVNIYDRPKDVDLIIDRRTFPATSKITLSLPDDLFDRWILSGGRWSAGIDVITATKEIQVTGPISATVGAIPLAGDEEAKVSLTFEGPAGLAFEATFREQIDGITVGGVTYQWVIPDTTPPSVVSVTPGGSDTDVELDVPLVISFDEPVSPINFSLEATPDPGDWMLYWNDVGTVVTATHTSFSPVTDYAVSVAAQDGSVNMMPTAYQWSFETTYLNIFLPSVLR